MQIAPTPEAPLAAPIFKQTEGFGAKHRVLSVIGQSIVQVVCYDTEIRLALSGRNFSASLDLGPAEARALAAELTSAADLLERGDK